MSKVLGKKISPDSKYWGKSIGTESKQYEFECSCGYIWIDFINQGCPTCSKTTNISSRPYDIKQPKEFAKK